MYEGVHARPDGDATVARLALTAARAGYDGVVLRSHGDAEPSVELDAVADACDVDVVDGVEVRADDRSRAAGLVGNYRSERTIVAVHGGDPDRNRFAVEQPAVDVLAHPMAGDGDVNHVLAKAAADNGVRLEFDLSPVLRGDDSDRATAVRNLRKLRELVETYDAPHVASAEPSSHLQLRAPRELAALGETVGLGRDLVREGLAEWGRLAERNRERHSDAFIEPGVRRGEHEAHDR